MNVNNNEERERIDSKSKLNTLVYKWAATRKLDPVKFEKVANNLCPDIEERPLSGEGIESFLNHFQGRIDEEMTRTVKARDIMLGQISSWGLEMVKHLFIVNTSGVAGCIALMTKFDQQVLFKFALVAFMVGVVLTLSTLRLGVEAFSVLCKQISKRADSLYAATNWQEYEDATKPIPTRTFNRWTKAADWAAVFAAAAVIVGLVLIIKAI